MKHRSLFSLLVLLIMLFSGQTLATEILRWEKLPLAIPLSVGQERVIFTDHSVSVGLPSAMSGKLRVQSADGAVYMQALAPFPSSRVFLKDLQNGSLILIDVSASDSSQHYEPVKILISSDTDDTMTVTDTPTQADRKPRHTGTPVAILLTRYAAQMLYAPPRTVEAVPGITTLPLRLPADLSELYPASPLVFHPLAAFGLNGISVTAVEVRNTASRVVVPDPRLLYGQFTAATFQHGWLGAKGTPEDTTVLYLVASGRPEQVFIVTPAKKSKSPDSKKFKKTATQGSVAHGG